MAVDVLSAAIAASGTALGFITGVVQQRTSRETAFNSRIDRELDELRAEVDLCRKERTEFEVVKIGVKMILPEMRRIAPGNAVMLAVACAFEMLPGTGLDMQELLDQLDKPDASDAR